MTSTTRPARCAPAPAAFHACEAAAGLLAGHQYWLTGPDFTSEFIDTAGRPAGGRRLLP